jgi:hypothetical protein
MARNTTTTSEVKTFIDNDDYKEIKRLAEEKGIGNISDLLRKAIEAYLGMELKPVKPGRKPKNTTSE